MSKSFSRRRKRIRRCQNRGVTLPPGSARAMGRVWIAFDALMVVATPRASAISSLVAPRLIVAGITRTVSHTAAGATLVYSARVMDVFKEYPRAASVAARALYSRRFHDKGGRTAQSCRGG
jgi:hypothetical protein